MAKGRNPWMSLVFISYTVRPKADFVLWNYSQNIRSLNKKKNIEFLKLRNFKLGISIFSDLIIHLAFKHNKVIFILGQSD
jgi:hypothetical protein